MTPNFLSHRHPSHDCAQAWFVFAVLNPGGPGFCRMLLVEAKNQAAVQTLELLVAKDGRVSRTCELMTVHRDCGTIGMRSDLAEEVPFHEFVADMVEYERLASTPGATDSFQDAVTPEERSELIARMGVASRAPVPAVRALPAPRVIDVTAEDVVADAEAALLDLGFKKPQIRKMLDKVGPSATRMPLGALVKKCLQGSAAA